MDWKLALQRVNNFVERCHVLREKDCPFDDRTQGDYTAWRTGVQEFLGQIDRQESSTWQEQFNRVFAKPSKVFMGSPDYAFMTKRHQEIMADAIGILAAVGEFVANKQVEELAKHGTALAVGMTSASERWPQITDREITEFLRREFNYTRSKIGKRLKKICGAQEQLRGILLRDICDAVRCYAHGLWKPAVILCGGALEGILSEPILRQPDAIRDAAYLKAYPQTKQAKRMENYRLCHYLDVAAELKVIRETTAKLGHGVRDYRNYIHPLTEIEEKQEITDNDARIACTLVFKILEEVGK